MKIQKNHLLLILKIAIIIAAFAVIINEADLEQIALYLTKIDLSSFVFAIAALIVAQIASAFRTRYYFKTAGLELNNKFSIGLYFTGMFFNTVLPGGIGGDGYKIYLLKKLAGFSKVKSLRILISDRASGLFILLLFSIVALFFSDFMNMLPHANIILVTCAIGLLPSYLISIKLLLKEQPKTAARAAVYSFFVQGAGIFCILFILSGLGVDIGLGNQAAGYISLFLLSSVLAVLPISIGGIGIREVSFLYGAHLLGLDPELGIAIALIYFAINLICSLNGLFFWHKLERLYNQN